MIEHVLRNALEVALRGLLPPCGKLSFETDRVILPQVLPLFLGLADLLLVLPEPLFQDSCLLLFLLQKNDICVMNHDQYIRDVSPSFGRHHALVRDARVSPF